MPFHVVPRDGKWTVLRDGATMQVADTQREAIIAARDLARQQRTELFIHGKDGRVRKRNSYGNDPYPPAG